MIGRNALRHGYEVEPVPITGNTEELGTGLPNDEAHLTVAVDGNDRILDCAETSEGERQGDCLDAGRQLPRNSGTGSNAHAVKTGGGALRQIAEGTKGDLTVVLVDEHNDIGRGCSTRLEQLPHRRRLKHRFL